jgi:hypothetical protein
MIRVWCDTTYAYNSFSSTVQFFISPNDHPIIPFPRLWTRAISYSVVVSTSPQAIHGGPRCTIPRM